MPSSKCLHGVMVLTGGRKQISAARLGEINPKNLIDCSTYQTPQNFTEIHQQLLVLCNAADQQTDTVRNPGDYIISLLVE